jgi:hypothetical protein
VTLRLAVPLALGALLLTAGGTAAARSPARLTLSSRQPLIVSGSHFRHRERVRVVVRAAGVTRVRRVRASRAGRFTARFGAVASGPCGRLSVVATGRRGSRAVLRGMAQPDCIVD